MTDLVYTGKPAGGPLNSDALPQNYDIVMYRGDTFMLYVTIADVNLNPITLTGSAPKAHLKVNYEDQAPVNFTCTLTGAPGQVLMSMTPAQTANIFPGNYIYDLQVTDSAGNVRTYLAGDVVVHNEVTK